MQLGVFFAAKGRRACPCHFHGESSFDQADASAGSRWSMDGLTLLLITVGRAKERDIGNRDSRFN